MRPSAPRGSTGRWTRGPGSCASISSGPRSPGRTPPADPTNPASASYDFSSIDAAVRDARARGLSVLLTVLDAPTWAEGPGRPASADPGSWRPSATALADFMRAVAARYSGGFDPDGPGPAPPLPAVQALQVWNEPNLSQYLTPQYDGQTAASPGWYREMLNASYAAVKAVDPRMTVVTAGTAPYGDPPGGIRVRPVEFWRQLLCVTPKSKKKKRKKHRKRAATSTLSQADACGGRAMFDVLAHHPIDTTGGPTRSAINPDDASTPDLGRIVRVLRAAERAGTVLPGKHPVWATELWWDSNPPNSAGAPLGLQARWIEQAMYLLWKQGASVVINLVIRDSTGGPFDQKGGAHSGIFFANGQPKPSYVAFRFPFVASKTKAGTLRAWGKAPAGGKLLIQAKRGGRWRVVRRLAVRSGAVFTAGLGLRGSQRLRAKVAGNKSLVWRQG